jgi:hypothetical protein
VTDYAAFTCSLPQSVHDATLAEVSRLGEDTPHHAVPVWPIIDPEVKDAVITMLGPNAYPDKCRHIHANHGGPAGDWHVDDYCGRPWPPGVRFAILCYFPQDTPPELGPTMIRVDGREILGGGPAGSCLLMKHTVEHRATANLLGQPRFMLKYLFRAEEDAKL